MKGIRFQTLSQGPYRTVEYWCVPLEGYHYHTSITISTLGKDDARHNETHVYGECTGQCHRDVPPALQEAVQKYRDKGVEAQAQRKKK